jgi:hypothetical protein
MMTMSHKIQNRTIFSMKELRLSMTDEEPRVSLNIRDQVFPLYDKDGSHSYRLKRGYQGSGTRAGLN